VLILYGLSILFTMSAIAISIGRNWQVGTALMVLSLAVIGVTRAVGIFQVSLHRWRSKERPRPASVERLRATVPAVLENLRETDRPERIADILVAFAQSAELVWVELIGSQPERLSAFTWRAAPTDAPSFERGVISATFALVAAGPDARLRFAWLSDLGDALESDILLQLVVDACDARLARTATTRARSPASQPLVN
jgi:UDP-GlcNAc:undecaprenyl-phosphate GlcNAc-1-phosphate transferase